MGKSIKQRAEIYVKQKLGVASTARFQSIKDAFIEGARAQREIDGKGNPDCHICFGSGHARTAQQEEYQCPCVTSDVVAKGDK